MAVIVKYVVERNGAEKMTFTTKAEADAYDRMLDMADDLLTLLTASQLVTDEQQQENLALYLAQHKDEVLQALGAKAKVLKKDKTSADSTADSTAEKMEVGTAAEVLPSSQAEQGPDHVAAELSLVSSAA